jgi:hypothetical protein
MKSRIGELTFPDFKTYSKATVNNTVWNRFEDRHKNP